MVRRLMFTLLLAASASHAGMLVIAEPLPEERDEVSAWLDNAARDVLGWPFLAPNNYAVTYTDGTYRYTVPGNGAPELTPLVVSRMSARCPTLGITYKDSIPATWTLVLPEE